MKILFISPYPPSLIRVRSYNLVRELSMRGHQITLVTVWADEAEREDIARLSQYVHNIHSTQMPRWLSYLNCLKALPTRTPLQAVYSWNPALLEQINGVNANTDGRLDFDIIHVEHLRGSKYGLRIKQLFPGIPVVWDSVDCISLLFKFAAQRSKNRINRWITSIELGRNQWYEGWLVKQFDHTIITSPIDRQALLDLVGSGTPQPPISIIPVGVDIEYFQTNGSKQRQKNRLVISGKMSYHANVSMVLNFVENIYPRILAAYPDIKLWIAGKDPTREIKALENIPGIEVTGTVDDLRPYIQQASVALSPITYGAGIQIKVLEAMACGTPVVSTSQAVSALQVVRGQDVLIADNPDEFTAYVLKLLDDQDYQRMIGMAGLAYVEKFHKWSSIVSRLEGIYHEAVYNKL
jgi:glycosyltransferase involved in cell wall biosynthesis